MFEYELPDVGEGVAEGELVVWHVDPGDRVTEDEVLAEVETDKAVVDLPAPVDGVVEQLHADPGDMVPVGDIVVTIDTDADGEPDTETAPESASSDTNGTENGRTPAVEPATTENGAAPETEVSTSSGRVFAPPHVRRIARELDVDIGAVEGSGPGGRVTEGDVRTAAEAAETETSAEVVDEPEEIPATQENGQRESAVTRREPTGNGETAGSVESADRDRTLAVPATRGVASDLGVDIDEVPTEKSRDGEAFVEPADVRVYAEAQQAAQAADAAATSSDAAGIDGESVAADTAQASSDAAVTESETTAAASSDATATATETDAGGTASTPSETAPGTTTAGAETETEAVTREPYRGIRRTIGDQMAESAFTAPHASHHDTAPAEGLVDARERLKPRAEEAGVHLTYMPFVMKAVAAVLPDYPAMNAQLNKEEGEILYHNRYHIGVAVATDAGLMVPVVEDVDRKGLLELAAEVNDLVERARNRELAPAELQGSTFTITNFGAIGGEYATPILNYPETGILGLGELTQRPVVENGEVVARHTLPLSVSIDHRVVDGAVSANFCNDLKTYLEDPIHLLL
jgi:pyruvate dehydrogenase E2 component (dihydrolipoamide acetyltransferase)